MDFFLQKGLDNNSNSRSKFITRKEGKKSTIESRNKFLQKKINSSSNSSLITKTKEEKEINNLLKDNHSLLIMEEIEVFKKNKKQKKENITEKKYIVDNIEDILSKISGEKLKLILQEILLYMIVVVVCIYHWIFLFISRDKLEHNFCFTNGQFQSCSVEQICKNYPSRMSFVIFNDTLLVDDFKSFDSYKFFVQENILINEYYKPFFVEYSHNLSKDKALSKLQIMHYSNDLINFAIVLSTKEKWNLFFRNFSLCESRNYFIVFVVMVATGGIIGSIVFGFLSDIFGRRFVIRFTLGIITLMTLSFAFFSYGMDNYYKKLYKEFDRDNKYKEINNDIKHYKEIFMQLYSQDKVREFFKEFFFVFCINIFFLSGGLWPLLKSCMALLIENTKSELNILLVFRKYNFYFGGIPAFCTSLIFANLNNFTLTFLILGIINFIFFVLSVTFLDESVRYFYEYCEWPELTETLMKIFKVDINEFRTLNDDELKQFRKEENIKSFNSSVKNNNYYIEKNGNDTTFVLHNSYFNLIKERNQALRRNIKRDTDFIIRLQNIRSNPLIIITCLISNRTFNNSKILILVVLILLYVTMNLIQKEFLETPYFTQKDLYINYGNNILINSIFFFLAITNYLSNLFFYGLYRINCFKTVIIISIIYNILALFYYHFATYEQRETPIYFNQYNPNMLFSFNQEHLSKYYLVILLSVYFLLNGVNFYVYLLILKISKTIYRCSYFSIHSIALIIAFVVTECVHIIMNHYFLFLSVLNILCLITFMFLSDFKELLLVVNDLKIDIHRPSKNSLNKQKNS